MKSVVLYHHLVTFDARKPELQEVVCIN